MSLSRRTFLIGAGSVLALAGCGSSDDKAAGGGKVELVYRLRQKLESG